MEYNCSAFKFAELKFVPVILKSVKSRELISMLGDMLLRSLFLKDQVLTNCSTVKPIVSLKLRPFIIAFVKFVFVTIA